MSTTARPTPDPAASARGLAVAVAVVPPVAAFLAARTLGASAALPALFFALEVVPTAIVAWLGGRDGDPGEPRGSGGVSVLVAAFQEERSIRATLASLAAQAREDLAVEILVADDGSTDGTAAAVRAAAEELPAAEIRLLSLPHRGKGAALNAALAAARHPVCVTVDADTELGPEALARLLAPFADERVWAAAGAVVVRNRVGFLLRHQFVEYRKNTLLRRGWSALGVLDQVPGAFGAYRTERLRAAGGFPEDSLTEDYEAIFRLRALAAALGLSIAVPTIASARAYTEGPTTIAGFVRQRTRWFAGFLSTIARFRSLFFARAAGPFGWVKLPLKLLDAVMPVVGLAALADLAVATARALQGALPGAALASIPVFLALRALVDVPLYLRARRLARRDERGEIAAALLAAATEGLAFAWLKMAAVQAAYPRALSAGRDWVPTRTGDGPITR